MLRYIAAILFSIPACCALAQTGQIEKPRAVKDLLLRPPKWQLAIAAGVSLTTKPKEFINYDGTSAQPALCLALKVSRRLSKRFEVGLNIQASDLVRRGSVTWYDAYHQPIGTYDNARIHIGARAIASMPFLSVSFYGFYFGPQVGYFITTTGTSSNTGSHAQVYYNDFRGYTGGLFAGYRKRLSYRWSLFTEGQFNYFHGETGANYNGIPLYGFHCFQGGLSIGARFGF